MLALVALLSGACQEANPLPGSQPAAGGQGSAGQPGVAGGGNGTTTPQEFAPAGGSFKRLTTSEYQASLRDLLGEVTIGDLEPDTFIDGFAKIGSAQVAISLNGVEKYELAADAATRQVFGDAARRSAFVGCNPSGNADTACFDSFVGRFGRLAFRRPLSDAERQSYVALAGTLSTTLGDPVAGLRLTTKALLLSPYFLYRLERGQADPSAKWWRYTSHELAGSLAYFLTNTTPDSALLDAADRDELGSVEGVRTQAQRLLAAPAGRASVSQFATELFRLQVVYSRAKDPGLFPQYTPALIDALAREVPALFQNLVFDQRKSALELFTTQQTFVNLELAGLYGLDTTGLTSDSWQAVTLPADGLRAGLLGTGAFLSLYANQKEGSPTLRGKFIRQFLLCQEIPDPPPDVSTVIEDPPPGVVLTKRQKLAAHREQPICAGCHQLMDPMGLTLENFDAIGAFRQTEHGLPIDASGDFDGTPFSGPVELGRLLAQSPHASECLVRNLYRYATGHAEVESEEPLLTGLSERFAQGGHDFQSLMVDLVTSDGFRYVAAAP
jgi:hypothetical protein